MTPEERAQAVVEAIEADPNSHLAPVVVTLMHIAAGIRNAEREARKDADHDRDCLRMSRDHWRTLALAEAERTAGLEKALRAARGEVQP